MIFSLSDEDYDNLDELSEHYNITKSGILRIGLSLMVYRYNHDRALWKDDGVKLRKRTPSKIHRHVG